MLQRRAILAAGLVLALSGPAPAAGADGDGSWLDRVNRANRTFNFWMLDHVFDPVARGYNWVMPKWGQERVRNVLQNLERPRDTVNSLLQAKFGRAGRHAASFVVDSTAGVAGAFLVAEHFVQIASPETTGETLGVYGLPSGAYLVLPLYGETSPRSLTGAVFDAALNPLFWIPGDAGTAATAGANLLQQINLLARQMPKPWADEAEWRVYEQRIADRPPYTEAKRLYFENLELDVAD